MSKRAFMVALAIGSACLARIVVAQPPSMQSIGGLNPESPSSSVSDISGDGTFVVGHSQEPNGKSHAIRWTADGGIEDLGTIDNAVANSIASGIADDGSVVVGYGDFQGPGMPSPAYRAFRWTSDTGMIQLGTLDDDVSSYGTCVSGDGSVIAGYSRLQASSGRTRPFRWTSSGMVDLGYPFDGFVMAMSRDGSTIVGFRSTTQEYAFRWIVGGEFDDMRGPGGFAGSMCRGVSPNGAVTVGSWFTGGETFACIWNGSVSASPLESYGATSWAEDASSNGRIVVGFLATEPCIWIDGEPIALRQLMDEAGADLGGLRPNGVTACSDNGRYIAGYGTLNGKSVGFRAVLPNNPPELIAAPQAVSVECTGGQNLVELLAIVDDVEGDELTVEWRVNGTLQKTENVAAGGRSSFEFDYSHGENAVEVTVSDADDSTTDGTTVAVDDTEAPSIVIAPNVKLNVDQAKLFASRSRLTPPEVTDLCDGDPALSNDAPSRLPIGKTTVVWTAIDEDGNVATASQIVQVVNRPPRASAGRDVTKSVTTNSVAVKLNGTRSSDPDKHKLKYRWTAPRVRFDDPKSSRPTGTFPLGTTEATLTVTDAAGAKSTDVVRITVKQKATKQRSRTQLAVDHTAASLQQGEAAANGSEERARRLAAVELSRRAYSQGAKALAAAYFGDDARSGRLLQALSVSNLSAAERYLKVYAATGDEAALAAGRHAYQAAAYGAN